MANQLYIKGYHYIDSNGLHLDNIADPGWEVINNNTLKKTGDNIVLENLTADSIRLHIIGIHDIMYYIPETS